jgi:hypothetical protein
MALVYENLGDGPRTHVLVIGVGGYRHLDGGPSPMDDPLLHGGLTQLSSPPLSALALRDRLVATNPNAWRAPLGSVDLLVSPHPEHPWPDGAEVKLEEPTMSNIKSAFDAWKKRCDSDSGNVAILYFCGHGLEKDEQYVLASDFGANENRMWENAIAVDSTMGGLSHCEAETQCVFIDACREPSLAAQSSPRIDAPALATFNDQLPDHRKHGLVLRSVDRGRPAFGLPGHVSYFTEALLEALLGAAAEEEDVTGDWVVTTGSLAFKFARVLAMVVPHLTAPRPEPGPSIDLYHPPDPPPVHVTVGCRPDEALGFARLSCRHQTKDIRRRRAPAARPWTLDVEAGYYKITATFERNRYERGTDLFLADPPERSRTVKVL